MVHIPPSLPPSSPPPLGGANPRQEAIETAKQIRDEILKLQQQLQGGIPPDNLRSAFESVAKQLQQLKSLLTDANLPVSHLLQRLIDFLHRGDIFERDILLYASIDIEVYAKALLLEIE